MTGTEPAGCEVRLLGPVEVRRSDGTEAAVGGPKERAVLAQLALDVGRAVSVESLSRGLWGDEPPRTATKTLQTYVARIRRALVGLATIEWTGSAYRLGTAGVGVDVQVVDDLVARAAKAPAEETVQLLGAALARWRGEPLADVANLPFAAAAADAISERREEIVEDLVEAQLACGRHAALIGDLEAAVGAHPFRERRWGQLMLALYRSGRQADALRAYQRARRILGDELGLEPGGDLRALEAAMVVQDPALDWRPPSAEAPGPVRASGPEPRPSGLPSGTVAFLLTDIEGSTRRWETDAEGTAALLRWHDEVIGTAVSHHGGVLLKEKGEGDSTFSVFGDPVSAADAAVEAQRRFRDHPDGPVPVRMAVHIGEAELREGDYFGPTVNRAARLRSVAHGGQILVSDAVASARRDHPGSTVSSRELGVVRLKDLEAPERVHQLFADGLADDFPPLRSVDVGFTNIPPDTTSFVGREDDIDQVLALFDSGRLVTLTGAGGSGKTRLSQRVGRSVAGQADDGAWFVDLAPLVDDDQVVEAAARALRVPEEAGRSTIELVCGRLRDSDALVILDNCEHVIEAAAALANVLLERCPEVRLLATSRERLRLPEETTWPVPPLVVDAEDVAGSEAVRLFVDRATAVQPTFRLTSANEAHVAAICRAVDGIPLAIELAAARLRMMSAEQLAVRLADRFGVLTTGHRSALPRQQTLRALVDWSHELLSDEERVAFRRLSVFRGGFDIDAAEAVLADEGLPHGVVLDRVSGLADKSLLVLDPGDPPRMRLLETLREYGHERLAEAGEVESLARRHAERCAALADQGWEVIGPRHAEIADRVAREADNVRAALRWAIEHGDADLASRIGAGLWGVWYTSEASGEGDRWLQEILELPPCEDAATRARLLVGAGNLASLEFDGDRAIPHLEAGVALAEATAQPDFVVYAQTALGAVRPGGDDLLRQAVELAGRHRSFAGVFPMVQIAHRSSDEEERRVVAERAADLARTSGDPYLIAIALEALAEQRTGRERKELLTEALELARGVGATRATVGMLSTLAHMAAGEGDIESVRRLLDEAQVVVSSGGRGLSLAILLHQAGVVLMEAGDPDGAADALRRALPIAEREGIAEGISAIHLTSALVLIERDDPAAAASHLISAIEHIPSWQEFMREEALRSAGVVLAMSGFDEPARKLYCMGESRVAAGGARPEDQFAERIRGVADRLGLSAASADDARPESLDAALEEAHALLSSVG